MEKKVGHKKPHYSWKEFGQDTLHVLGILAVGTVAIALANYKTTPLVVDALLGREIPCQQGAFESTFEQAPFNVIAVLGGGYMPGGKEPNTLEKERINAAANLVAAGYLDPSSGRVLFLDDVPDGISVNSNPSYFQQKVDDISHGTMHIAPGKISTVDDSVSTAKNMEDLEKFIYGTRWNVLVVTSEGHIKRAELDAKIRGICPAFISTQDVFGMFDPDKAKIIAKRAGSNGEREREEKEFWATIYHLFDPYMVIPTRENEQVSG